VQRRLIDDLVELEIYTEKIAEASTKCRHLLDKLLSAPDKSFEIIFCGELFDFGLPFTQQEHLELSTKRRQLIDKLMLSAFVTGNWSDILTLAQGTDPLDMQCEIIKSEDLYNVTDSNGNIITALPLNEDSHIVRVQRFSDEMDCVQIQAIKDEYVQDN